MKKTIAVPLFLAALVNVAWAQNFKEKTSWLGGAGSIRCEKWIETREEEATSTLGFGLKGWVVGFVDGALHREHWLSDFSENDVLTRIDFYCRQHESNLLIQAALVATGDLMFTQSSRIRKRLKER